jgi:hypothetical protein
MRFELLLKDLFSFGILRVEDKVIKVDANMKFGLGGR